MIALAERLFLAIEVALEERPLHEGEKSVDRFLNDGAGTLIVFRCDVKLCVKFVELLLVGFLVVLDLFNLGVYAVERFFLGKTRGESINPAVSEDFLARSSLSIFCCSELSSEGLESSSSRRLSSVAAWE